MKFPKIKPTLKAFIINEDGKISKKAVFDSGILLTSLIAAGKLASGQSPYNQDCEGIDANANIPNHSNSAHQNDVKFEHDDEGNRVVAEHEHCLETHTHSNHDNHCSCFHTRA